MGRLRTDDVGAPIPRCGARTRSGDKCREPPAVHPTRPGYYVRSGRCRAHGGVSTGPRTPEGKAVVAETLRRMWVVAFEAEGKVKPSKELCAEVATYLDHRTWEQAQRETILSRRALLRIERGGYCERSELDAIQSVLGSRSTGPVDGGASSGSSGDHR